MEGTIKAALIFVATSGFVAFLTFVHTNYTTCRVNLDATQLRFAVVLDELYYRWGVVHGACDGNSDLAALITLFDPKVIYSYQEFKDKSSFKIAKEAGRLVERCIGRK